MMKTNLSALRQELKCTIELVINQKDEQNLIIATFISQLSVLETQVQQAMDILVGSKQREALVLRQMRQLQQLYAILLNRLWLKKEHNNCMLPFIVAAEHMLLRLLEFQRVHYGHYFAQHFIAPEIYIQQCFTALGDKQLLLTAGLKQKGVAIGLKEVLCPVFLNRGVGEGITYRQLAYLKQLQQLLINFCKHVGNEPFNELLVAYLVYLNFNHGPFIVYIRLALEEEFLTLLGDKEKFELLCAKEKYFACLLVKNIDAFDETQPSAKHQVMDYLTNCIVYHHRRAMVNPNLPRPGNTLPLDKYRVKLSISADVLAYLIRLFIEVGVLEADPRSKLLQFVSQHFQTAGIGDELLSVNSLGTKYKQVVQRTALNVRTLLKRMTKKIETDFDC